MGLLDRLNPVQRQAAMTIKGPLLLLAGAGSGKTSVLTHRIAYMVEQGIAPYNILAITFTNKAAREMKERVAALVQENAGDIWVSTFHSCCVRILRREIGKIGYDNSFTIYDSDDQEKLMKTVIKELGVNDKLFPPKSMLGVISSQKNELIGPEEYAVLALDDYKQKTVSKIYTAYQRKLQQSNALDFDDLIFKTVELFASQPEVLTRYQGRFRYVLVDEYQDTNTAQYELVRLISEAHGNLCVVGDDDQSIYGWRGANIRNILDFEKDFPGAVVLKLEQNYRSTGNILNAANAVIANNTQRKGKTLWTDENAGQTLKFFKADSDLEEADFVTATIKANVNAGRPYSDHAVLYRTNAQSRVLEDSLVHKSIRYRIFGGVRFYERREIKDVLAYLKAICNPLDGIAVQRIINVPKRGIGGTTVDTVAAYARDMDVAFYNALLEIDNVLDTPSKRKKIKEFTDLMEGFRNRSADLPVAQLLQAVLDETGYVQDLLVNDEEGEERAANVQELVNKAIEFEKNAENPLLAAFLEDVALVADIDNFTEEDDTVVLMTLHSAKGLEFPTVFIAGFEEGVFPGFRSMMSTDRDDMEEERRLCYVGITRAKKELYITAAAQRRMHGQIVCNAPSRFLKEIPAELVESFAREKPTRAKAEWGQTRSRALADNAFVPKRPVERAAPPPVPVSSKVEPPDYTEGDFVKQMKYGVGKVLAIRPAGADYEVTVEFPTAGTKKFMAHLSRLEKADASATE